MTTDPLALDEVFLRDGAAVLWGRFGAGPPVVLCHGTPWSSFVWRAAVGALCADHSVFVWDMLGYGQSDKPDADVSLAAQGALLADLVDHWQLETPDVIAHDFGGAVVLRAHLLHGVPVSSLALVDVVAVAPWGSPFFRLVHDNAAVFAALPANLHAALVREYIAGASAAGLEAAVLEALVAPWLGELGQAAFYRQIAQADERFTDEIEPLYATIEAPTLIVWGTEDRWIPVDRAARLHAAIRDSELEQIAGAGHLVHEDRPDELVRVLRDWIDRRRR